MRARVGGWVCVCVFPVLFFPTTAESFGVSAHGVVRGGPEVRFHEGSTRVPPGFHEGSTRFCKDFGGEHEKEHRMLLGISPERVFFGSVFIYIYIYY